MAEFAKYYVDFLWQFVQNVGTFFYSIGYAFVKFFVLDIGDYFTALGDSVGNFNVLGWICLIFVSIVAAALIFFVVYRLVQLIRRYIIYRGKAVDKDKMAEEIARLKDQCDQLVAEKNKIFALKIGSNITDEQYLSFAEPQGLPAGGTPTAVVAAPVVAATTEDAATAGGSRFSKLIDLDDKYSRNPNNIEMAESDLLTLEQVVDRFVNFAASQLKLYYTHDTIRLFFAGLATGKILILEGISGTGKTSLPYAMGKFFNNNTSIISVQPSWRDRAELVGYLNEFTKKFNETDFLTSLYEATLREDPNFIVLDEMNLARIEYYFADFLSIMEMPDVSEWKIDLVPTPQPTDPKNVVYGKLLVPQNIWFIGTANNDDSTFTITDKVYDRAIAISLNQKANYFDAPLTESYNCSAAYLESLFEKARSEFAISDKNLDLIKELDTFIRAKFKIAFGNRIMKQLKLFVPAYVGCGGTEIGAIDFIVCSKILRKFTSLNLPFLQKEMSELITFFDKKFGKGNMPYCVDYINELKKMN